MTFGEIVEGPRLGILIGSYGIHSLIIISQSSQERMHVVLIRECACLLFFV